MSHGNPRSEKKDGIDGFARHPNREIALLHKPSKTLIQADLMFNLPGTEQFLKAEGNMGNALLNKIAGYFASVGKGQQRFIWYAMAKDKARFAEGVKRVAGWEFERVVPCHGDVIESDGNKVFRELFRWHLEY